MRSRPGVKTAAVVLMAVMSAAVSMPVSALVISSTEHKSECPMHKSSPASPSPTKHNCCQPGHSFLPLKQSARPRDGTGFRLHHPSEFDTPISQAFTLPVDLSSTQGTRSHTLRLRI